MMKSADAPILDTLFDCMPSGLLLLESGVGGRILRINSRAFEILGLNPDLRPVSLRDHLPIYLSPLVKLLKTSNQDICRGELMLHLPSRDEESTLGFNLKRILDETGKVLTLFIFSDISQVRRDQLMVEKIKDELHQSKKLASLGTLVAGVAHELNNPLTGISMSTSLLKMNLERLQERLPKLPTDSLYAEVSLSLAKALGELEKVSDANEKASILVGDLLSYAKPTQLNLMPFPLHRLLQEIISALKGHPHFSRMSLRIEGDSEFLIACDRVKLEQVFYNLLKNAADATDGQGDVCLFYTQELDETEREFVSVHVRDNGPGIEKGVIDHVFDPFFTTKGHGGIGLGLSISYRTVEQHGGHLTVKSSSEGAEHIVTLPIYIEAPKEATSYA
jgi:two-component system NtrC family sensor kinase